MVQIDLSGNPTLKRSLDPQFKLICPQCNNEKRSLFVIDAEYRYRHNNHEDVCYEC